MHTSLLISRVMLLARIDLHLHRNIFIHFPKTVLHRHENLNVCASLCLDYSAPQMDYNYFIRSSAQLIWKLETDNCTVILWIYGKMLWI